MSHISFVKSTRLIDIPINKAKFCVLDFETTGKSAAQGKAIEIGLVKVKNLKIGDTFQSFLNPEQTIPYFITQLTTITNNDVEDAPLFSGIADDIIEFIGDSILVAHNMPFDYSFLKKEFADADIPLIDNPTLCTLKLARKVFPNLKSKSLSSLVKHLRLRHRNVHRALGDASVTAKLLIKLVTILKEEHNIENLNDLLSFQTVASSGKPFRIMKKKLADGFASLPNNPGIYLFKNAKDRIIYIGKAKSLKTRVRNYFSSNADRRTKKIIRAASRLDHITTNSELTALLAEAELIKLEVPSHNHQLKKYSQTYFIKLNQNHAYPDISVTKEFDFDGNNYFGPYNNRETAAALKEILNRTFCLRECTDKELAKKRKCYLQDIERCYGPCIDEVKEKYNEEILKVVEFLGGQNQSAINRLLEKMKYFSQKQKYEEAAEIRDTVNLILEQLNKASILAEPINSTSVFIEVTERTQKDYLLLLEGKVFVKDYILKEDNLFEAALEDYYAGTLHLFPGMEDKDLEKIKITLSWLVKNRNKVKLYYLNEYESVQDLMMNVEQRNGSKMKGELVIE
jgi:DNA polymerase-3 subunit epsilon